MSVRVESVASEAQSFSLNDYVQPRTSVPAAQPPATRLAFNLDTVVKRTAAPAGAVPHLTFNLALPKKEVAFTAAAPAAPSDRKLPAGLLNGSGGDSAEIVRLQALLEEGRLAQRRLEKQLNQTEQSVVRANKAIETERKANAARVAQVTAELKASRESETRARAELANSPALKQARAEADVFKLQAEGAVAIEAEFAAARAALETAKAEHGAVAEELDKLRHENVALAAEIERVTQLLGQTQARGDLSEGAADAVSAELAVLHQKEVDELTAAIATEKQHRAIAEALVPEIQSALEAAKAEAASITETAQALEAAKVEATASTEAAQALEAEATSRAAAAEEMAAAATARAEAAEKQATCAEARAAAAEGAAEERIEAFKRQLPVASQAALDDYAASVALAKSARGRDRDFAARDAAEALHVITTGRATKKIFHTRDRLTQRVNTTLSLDLPDELPRTAALALGGHPQVHTADHDDSLSVLEIPKSSMEERVSRAVFAIRADLIGALRERKEHYTLHAN